MVKFIKQFYHQTLADRRRVPRYKAMLGVHLAVVAPRKEGIKLEPIIGRTRDISENGLLISLPLNSPYQLEFIKIGATLRIVLALPKKTIDLKTIVVRCETLETGDVEKGQLVAVEITDMEQEDESTYKEFLSTLR